MTATTEQAMLDRVLRGMFGSRPQRAVPVPAPRRDAQRRPAGGRLEPALPGGDAGDAAAGARRTAHGHYCSCVRGAPRAVDHLASRAVGRLPQPRQAVLAGAPTPYAGDGQLMTDIRWVKVHS